MSKMVVVAIAGCLLLLVGAGAHYLFVPHSPVRVFFSGTGKVWAHRTLSDGSAENTTEGLRRVFELGAVGCEIDVIYEKERRDLFVISEEMLSAGIAPVLTLKELLAQMPSDRFLWIDFWNLRLLEAPDADSAIAQLHGALIDAGLVDRAIVESLDATRLKRVAESGCFTSLWVTIRPSKVSRTRHLLDLLRAAYHFNHGESSAVSMDAQQYEEQVAGWFDQVPVHLFTVNDSDSLRTLSQDSRVRIVLTDSVQKVLPR